jgi:hypothetical protein
MIIGLSRTVAGSVDPVVAKIDAERGQVPGEGIVPSQVRHTEPFVDENIGSTLGTSKDQPVSRKGLDVSYSIRVDFHWRWRDLGHFKF